MASVSTSPAITASDASSVATAAKNAGLSSWRSRWYASGSPLSSVSIAVSAPITPADRPRTSSAGSGFFLLGIIELPVENASATRTNPKRGFDHQVSSSASRERWTIARAVGRQHLDDEVAVRDGIERVARDAIEAELGGGRLAVERVARAGERARAERRHVDPPPRVGEPAAVALQHLDVGEQVMGEQDGLRGLDVGRAGQDRLALALREIDEGDLERHEPRIEAVDRPSRPEAQVRGDLVVARPARVELAADRPDPLGQQRLEVEVDVLQARVPGDRPGLDVGAQGDQPALERRDLVVGEQPGPPEAAHVRDRARDVVERELRVHVDRAREVGHPRIGPFVEPPAPHPHDALLSRSRAPAAARPRPRA